MGDGKKTFIAFSFRGRGQGKGQRPRKLQSLGKKKTARSFCPDGERKKKKNFILEEGKRGRKVPDEKKKTKGKWLSFSEKGAPSQIGKGEVLGTEKESRFGVERKKNCMRERK